jgi:hypothetical protein
MFQPHRVNRVNRQMESEMKIFVSKVALAVSVALATLVAAAGAASAQPRHQAGSTVYDAQANPIYGFGPRTTVQPGDVISGNRLIARDPDPFIRDQLLRDYNSGRPD